jgi:hypothetical protein
VPVVRLMTGGGWKQERTRQLHVMWKRHRKDLDHAAARLDPEWMGRELDKLQEIVAELRNIR